MTPHVNTPCVAHREKVGQTGAARFTMMSLEISSVAAKTIVLFGNELQRGEAVTTRKWQTWACGRRGEVRVSHSIPGRQKGQGAKARNEAKRASRNVVKTQDQNMPRDSQCSLSVWVRFLEILRGCRFADSKPLLLLDQWG